MLMPPESLNRQTGYMLTIVLTDQDTAESTTAVYSQFRTAKILKSAIALTIRVNECNGDVTPNDRLVCLLDFSADGS
jgi:hypothetical protein